MNKKSNFRKGLELGHKKMFGFLTRLNLFFSSANAENIGLNLRNKFPIKQIRKILYGGKKK